MELKCSWCGEIKPAEFMVRRDAKQPYIQSNIRCCKQCSSQYQRNRYLRPDVRAKQQRLNTEWRRSHPEKMAQYAKQFAADRPNQSKARWRVAHLLRRGQWTRQTCVICGISDTEAHHDSYAPAHWETVRWLCKQHHEQWHQILDPVKNSVLEEDLVAVEQMRDRARTVQEQITALRKEFHKLNDDANALELSAWNKVVEQAEPLFRDFAAGRRTFLPSANTA